MLKRLFDLVIAICCCIIFFIPCCLISLLIRFTSPGPILYWSTRLGKNGVAFSMPKYRTMVVNTPVIATHLLRDPKSYLTPIGSILRKTSLDELPQLWSILVGDMSFVGPRPALINQFDLIKLRSEFGITRLLPGLTGLAQINGRDELDIQAKVDLDYQYLKKQSFLFDLKIMFVTFLRVIRCDGVVH